MAATSTYHHISSRGAQGAVPVGALVVLRAKAYSRYVERANRERADRGCASCPDVERW